MLYFTCSVLLAPVQDNRWQLRSRISMSLVRRTMRIRDRISTVSTEHPEIQTSILARMTLGPLDGSGYKGGSYMRREAIDQIPTPIPSHIPTCNTVNMSQYSLSTCDPLQKAKGTFVTQPSHR